MTTSVSAPSRGDQTRPASLEQAVAPAMSRSFPLLVPSDPPVVELDNADGAADILLLADHAGRAIPEVLDRLGLDEAILDRHIAYDIGVDLVTRSLARHLNAPALIHGYSRLLIDPNRPLEDPTSICQISDRTIIPGNCGLSAQDTAARVETFFDPYHAAIVAALDWYAAVGRMVTVVAVHSFTPMMGDRPRPWEVGVLWNDDERLAVPLMEGLRAQGLCVGDNQPYDGRNLHGYTMEKHALPRRLPYALIEIRQDLVSSEADCEAWAKRLSAVIGPIVEGTGA